jgi:hypothetical protein
MLGYVGAGDEENINLLDLARDLSILYGWKNPFCTRNDTIYLAWELLNKSVKTL